MIGSGGFLWGGCSRGLCERLRKYVGEVMGITVH